MFREMSGFSENPGYISDSQYRKGVKYIRKEETAVMRESQAPALAEYAPHTWDVSQDRTMSADAAAVGMLVVRLVCTVKTGQGEHHNVIGTAHVI